MHDSPSDYSDFQTRGYPGKYISSETVPDGQTVYTGSKFGASAVIVKTHGSAVLHFNNGGQIAAANLTAGILYEFSILTSSTRIVIVCPG